MEDLDEQMQQALIASLEHARASAKTLRFDWTRQQWVEDARKLMHDLHGSVSSLLNGHVTALIETIDEYEKESRMNTSTNPTESKYYDEKENIVEYPWHAYLSGNNRQTLEVLTSSEQDLQKALKNMGPGRKKSAEVLRETLSSIKENIRFFYAQGLQLQDAHRRLQKSIGFPILFWVIPFEPRSTVLETDTESETDNDS